MLTDECKFKQLEIREKLCSIVMAKFRSDLARTSHRLIQNVIQMNAYWLLIPSEHFSFSWADRSGATGISSDSLVSWAFQFIFFPSLAYQPLSEFPTRSFVALAFVKIVGKGSRWILRRGAAISIESWENSSDWTGFLSSLRLSLRLPLSHIMIHKDDCTTTSNW